MLFDIAIRHNQIISHKNGAFVFKHKNSETDFENISESKNTRTTVIK